MLQPTKLSKWHIPLRAGHQLHRCYLKNASQVSLTTSQVVDILAQGTQSSSTSQHSIESLLMKLPVWRMIYRYYKVNRHVLVQY